MPFFQNIDAKGLVEGHLTKLMSLEERQAEEVLREYRRIRVELRDRLDRLPPGSFSAQQLRGVIVQVESAINAMGATILDRMKSAAYEIAGQGVEDLMVEIDDFEREMGTGAAQPINLDAVAIATDTREFLLNQYQSSLDAYGQGLISQLTAQLIQSMIGQQSLSLVIQNMGRFFQGEEWKLLRIARTELHHVYGIAKLNGMFSAEKGSIPDIKKALYHPKDSRTAADSYYVDRLNPVVPLKDPFVYRWRGKVRVFQAPPDRPNDRSILIPYRDAWDS